MASWNEALVLQNLLSNTITNPFYGNFEVSGNLTVGGDLDASGVSHQNLDVSQNLTVGGTTTLTGDLTVGGTTTLTGDLSGINSNLSGNLIVDEDTTIKGKLFIDGTDKSSNGSIELKGDTGKSAFIDFGSPATQDFNVRLNYNPTNTFFKITNDIATQDNFFLVEDFKNFQIEENYLGLINTTTGVSSILNPQSINFWNGSSTVTTSLLSSTTAGNAGYYDRTGQRAYQFTSNGSQTQNIYHNIAFSHYTIHKLANGNKQVQFYITVGNSTNHSETLKVSTWEGAGYGGNFDIQFNLVDENGNPYTLTNAIGVTANLQNTFGALTSQSYTTSTPNIPVDNNCFSFDIQILGTISNPSSNSPIVILGVN